MNNHPHDIKQSLAQMFGIQNQLNTKSYKTDWLDKGRTGEYDYRIAAGDELHEFLRTLPFAWWSGAIEDRQNCITELVDAWHFLMSQAIIDANGDLNAAVEVAMIAYDRFAAQGEYALLEDTAALVQKRTTRKLISELYADKDAEIYLYHFFDLCYMYGVKMDQLSARYVAKATLNKFRQANGYSDKPRTYIKNWKFANGNSGEDNKFLADWVDAEYEGGVVVDETEVYAWLSRTYSMVVR